VTVQAACIKPHPGRVVSCRSCTRVSDRGLVHTQTLHCLNAVSQLLLQCDRAECTGYVVGLNTSMCLHLTCMCSTRYAPMHMPQPAPCVLKAPSCARRVVNCTANRDAARHQPSARCSKQSSMQQEKSTLCKQGAYCTSRPVCPERVLLCCCKQAPLPLSIPLAVPPVQPSVAAGGHMHRAQGGWWAAQLAHTESLQPTTGPVHDAANCSLKTPNLPRTMLCLRHVCAHASASHLPTIA
jgi:hypothetical protein